MAHQTFDDPPHAKVPPPLPIAALREIEKTRLSTVVIARDLYRTAHKFGLLDAKLHSEPRVWSTICGQMLEMAEALQYVLKRPANRHERVLRQWSLMIAPSRLEVARAPWQQLEGLSPGFVLLQALFEAALFRAAKTWLSFAWVTSNGWYDTLCEHQGIERDYGLAIWRLNRLCDEMAEHAVPLNAADRILIRRAHMVRALGNRVFNLKYRRAIRKWERNRGEHLPERRLRKPRRLMPPGITRPIGDWNFMPVKLTLRYLRND